MALFRIVRLDLLHICVVFFVHFLHNRNALLVSLGVLRGEKDLCSDRRLFEKKVLEKNQYF